MRTLILSIGFALVALCAQDVKSRGLDVVSGEIDGNQVFYVRDELLIKPVNDIDISGIAETIGAAVLDSMPQIGWYRLKLEPDVDAFPVFEDLQGSPGIQYCILHEFIPQGDESFPDSGNATRDDPPQEIGWPITITNADDEWARLTTSPVKIAILDTGVDQVHVEHPDGEFYGQSRIEVGRDWVNWSGGPYDLAWDDDDDGHGTHRVGEIAAPWDGHGVAGIVAGSFGDNRQICRVQIEKVAAYNAGFSNWAVPMAMLYVIQQGARVISLSVYNVMYSTNPNSSYVLWEEAFSYINDQWTSVVVLCCTGNSGGMDDNRVGDVPWITYPAAWSCDFDCVIAVGSSTHDDVVWSDSEWRQAWDEGHFYHGEVSVLAPGGNQGHPYSYWTTHRSVGGVPTWSNAWAGGTSGATAFAAGIAGMLIAKHPLLVNHQIKTQLQNTCTMIPPPPEWAYDDTDCWGHSCWCERVGSGRVDALRCFNLRYSRSCPSLRPQHQTGGDVGAHDQQVWRHEGEIEVFDLLGRKLCSFLLPGYDEASVLRHIRQSPELSRGAKILRLRTEHEVRTWRVVP